MKNTPPRSRLRTSTASRCGDGAPAEARAAPSPEASQPERRRRRKSRSRHWQQALSCCGLYGERESAGSDPGLTPTWADVGVKPGSDPKKAATAVDIQSS